MSNTPITSLPGYPYFYAIPINGYIRDGPESRTRRSSKSRLQDRHSLPPQCTPPPPWSPYTIEGLAELDGLNEIPRHIYPDRQHRYENKHQQVKRPQSTPPQMEQRRKSRLSSISTRQPWTLHKPQTSSPLSSSSSVNNFQDLFTIEENEPIRSSERKPTSGVSKKEERREEDMSEEERIQVVLIESIILMLHNLQPSYIPQPKPSRKEKLSRQPSIRISPMYSV